MFTSYRYVLFFSHETKIRVFIRRFNFQGKNKGAMMFSSSRNILLFHTKQKLAELPFKRYLLILPFIPKFLLENCTVRLFIFCTIPLN
jgi:hypothetical protein